MEKKRYDFEDYTVNALQRIADALEEANTLKRAEVQREYMGHYDVYLRSVGDDQREPRVTHLHRTTMERVYPWLKEY